MSFHIKKLPAKNTAAADALNRHLHNALDVKLALAGARQIRIGQAVKTLGVGTRHLDGLGELIGAIDAHTYFYNRHKDPHYWDYAENRKKYYQENGAALVKNQVGRAHSKYIGCSMREIDNPKFHIDTVA